MSDFHPISSDAEIGILSIMQEMLLAVPAVAYAAHFPGCAQPRLKECPVFVTFASVSGEFVRRTSAVDFAKN